MGASPETETRPRVVFTSPLPGHPETLLEGIARTTVHPFGGSRTEEELAELLREATGTVTLLSDPVTDRVLDACPGLRVIANYAVGYNNIDVASARARGISVTHTPDVLTEATADLTWSLLLAAARRITEGHAMVLRGEFEGWAPNLLLGMDLHGKTLGIVGMGRIGRAVARRAPGFGVRVVYAQQNPIPGSEEEALRARRLPLRELIETSDIVSLHCPLTEETRHLIDAEALAAMKPGALLINTARGAVVDEAALVATLRKGRISAGLDVYEREPEITAGLDDLPNAVLLPHIGSAGAETRESMARMAAGDVRLVLEGQSPRHPVPET